ncbi:MAG: DNA primase [Dehalococcoidia bacterium]|nr:DNA primase [Dehalococcoidia bacterium]
MSITAEVKQRIDIVELVSEYVSLQKAGRNFKGLCPFHSEKHPSFFVFPGQQTWHCFGACGTGGDIFSFIMKKEGFDFGQALQLLARRAGITLTSPETLAKVEDKEEESLFQINESAAQYYHHLLLTTKVGEVARNYLSKRKVNIETITEFRLGLSPDSWETIKKYLTSKGHEEKELFQAGLIIEREDKSNYDRFRNKLMFPICDIQGRVTGFGARALDDSLPKYINSPQTPIFDKSNSLYGIDKAKTAIRQKNLVIVVEGYMDVLTAHQHGWQNVVAAMGTSLTEKQVNIIKRLTKNISLALDADAAGKEGTLRGREVLYHSLDKKGAEMLPYSRESARSMHKGEEPSPLLAQKVKLTSTLDAEINVLCLPPGKDPDELISEDPAAWQSLVEQATPILDFIIGNMIAKVDTTKAKGKSLVIETLSPIFDEIEDPVQQSHYVRQLARELKLEESEMKAALRKLRGNRKRLQPTEPREQSRLARQLVSNPIEEYCLALLLRYPELRQLAQELLPEHFEYTENRELFVRWQSSSDIPPPWNKLDANLLEQLNYLLNKPIIEENNREQQLALSDCILRLQERLSRKVEVGRELMLDATRQKEGINAELAKLDKEGIDSSQQLKEILIKRTKGIK